MTEAPKSPTEVADTAKCCPVPSVDDEESVEDVNLPVARTSHARIMTEEHWEVVKADLLPMFMERRTLSEISATFSISVNTAGTWRARLIEDLRKEASGMQARDYVMDCISSLRLARAEAWRAVRESTTTKDRRAGLQLVTQIENQSAKLGAMIGLYGSRIANPLQPGATELPESVVRVHAMLEELLGGFGTGLEQFQDVQPPDGSDQLTGPV